MDRKLDAEKVNTSALTGLLGKLRGRTKPLHVLIVNGMDRAVVFVLVKVFGGLAYDRRFLKGRYFERFWSPGWRWAFNGMMTKVFTGHGRGIPWPISSQCDCGRDVDFHVDDLNNFQGSVYFQAFNGGRIHLGRGVWIARGCALITTNHKIDNPDLHDEPQDIVIGDHCWLGANVFVAPGVILGPHTVVAANAAVTKSFPGGWCVIGGVPAKKIKDIERSCEEGDHNEKDGKDAR
ncbi:acyltransferase [Rubneribacter sp.]